MDEPSINPCMKSAWAIAIGLKCAALFLCLVAFLPCVFSEQVQHSASLSGTVRDSSGKGVADAVVKLQSLEPAQMVSGTTDAEGKYRFSAVLPGQYTLTVSADGFDEPQPRSLSFGEEAKSIDVTLTPAKASASSMQPQFSDEPEFTVAGVKDTTNLGGHGSNAVVHARNNLAREAASLGKSPASESSADRNEAAKSLREQLSREPNNAEIHHRLGELEEQRGDPLEALRHYQRAAELNSSEPYIFDWGSELLLHHAPEPAIEVFKKGHSLFPKSARLMLGVGAAYFALGSNDQALRNVYEASDLNQSDPVPYLFLGKTLLTEKAAPAEAVERLHRFLALQPQNAEANYYYAVALRKQAHGPADPNSGDPARGFQIESLLKRAVELNPRFADAHLQLGIIYSERSDIPLAVSAFERAAQSRPEMEEPHYRLAQAYRQVGEADKARKEVEIYERLSKESEQKAERERHEIRQFVYTLRDQQSSQPR